LVRELSGSRRHSRGLGWCGLYRRKKYEKEIGIFLNRSQISLSLGIVGDFPQYAQNKNERPKDEGLLIAIIVLRRAAIAGIGDLGMLVPELPHFHNYLFKEDIYGFIDSIL
jgi:hypothetical protein